jgi:ferredoxin
MRREMTRTLKSCGHRTTIASSCSSFIPVLNSVVFSRRYLSSSSEINIVDDKNTVQITWRKKGFEKVTQSPIGWNLMRAAQKEDIALEGACEGVCACSTCHVILEDDIWDALPDAEEDEDDMLDQAFGLGVL